MRGLLAGILGGIAMYVWATVAHLSPLAQIGVHVPPHPALTAAALKLELGETGGVYVYSSAPLPMAGGKPDAGPPPKAATSGLLSYTPNGPAGLSPKQLGFEFGLEMVEAMLAAFVVALAGGGGFARRLGLATLVGVIAGIATNLSYWNWYGFGLDYTLANAFIETVKFVVAGAVIALVLGRAKKAAAT
jgi:hypothetical protein